MSNPSKRIQNNEPGENCISFDVFFRYIEKNATPLETKAVEKHLSSCEICRQTMAEMIRLESNPITEAEELAAVKDLKKTPEEQVEFIMDAIRKEAGSDEEEDETPESVKLPGLWGQYWQAAAVILVLIGLGGGYGGLTYYKTTHQINLAENILKENLKVHILDEPRFSGDYNYTSLGTLMSEKETYTSQAKSRLLKAIENGSESSKARQFLIEIYIKEKKYAQADSILNELQQKEGNSTTVLNNFGVLFFEKGDFGKAADFFQKAIAANPNYAKGYFNLALAYKALENNQQAIAMFTKYLEFEHDESRRGAAEHHIQELQRSGGDLP